MIDLSDETRVRVQRLFPEPRWAEVEVILWAECGDALPLVKPSHVDLVERIRFAVSQTAISLNFTNTSTAQNTTGAMFL